MPSTICWEMLVCCFQTNCQTNYACAWCHYACCGKTEVWRVCVCLLAMMVWASFSSQSRIICFASNKCEWCKCNLKQASSVSHVLSHLLATPMAAHYHIILGSAYWHEAVRPLIFITLATAPIESVGLYSLANNYWSLELCTEEKNEIPDCMVPCYCN